MRKMLVIVAITCAAACSVDVAHTVVEGEPDGGAGNSGGDAGSGASITIHGTAYRQTTSAMVPVAGAAAPFTQLDGTMLAMATTDGNGEFTLTVPTNGMRGPIDGLVAIHANDTYTGVTLLRHVTSSVPSITVILFEESALNAYAAASGTNHHSPADCVLVRITNAAGAPLAGAQLSVVTGNVRYNDIATGGPSLTRDTTDTSGLVWVLGLSPPGTADLTASAPNQSFDSFAITLGENTCAQLDMAAK